jgi:hypothetical protein
MTNQKKIEETVRETFDLSTLLTNQSATFEEVLRNSWLIPRGAFVKVQRLLDDYVSSSKQLWKQELREEIEKLREEEHCWYMHDKKGICCNDVCREEGICSRYCPGVKKYNEALEDILSLLEKK